VKFVIFVIDKPRNRATDTEMAAIDEFNGLLEANKYWVMAAGISGGESVHLIDNREKRDQVLPGSLIGEAENYTGFWIIESDSDEHALELAKEASRACNRRVELRPFLR
jgi:hypothetical protein